MNNDALWSLTVKSDGRLLDALDVKMNHLYRHLAEQMQRARLWENIDFSHVDRHGTDHAEGLRPLSRKSPPLRSLPAAPPTMLNLAPLWRGW